MSHKALQRALVRLLYDPARQPALAAGEDPVAADLSARERGWLAAVDPRALRADPYRRARSLRALLEEFPVCAALASDRRGGVRALDAFFSSDTFHRSIQSRGSMALAFGRWLAEGPAPGAARARRGRRGRSRGPRDWPHALALERGFAAARRAAPAGPAAPAARLALAPGVALLSLPAGALERYQAARAQLGADPVAALLREDFRFDPRALPPAGGPPVPLLIEARPGGQLTVEALPEALAEVLSAAGDGAPRAAVLAAARACGAEPGEDAEIVDDLVSQGLLAGI